MTQFDILANTITHKLENGGYHNYHDLKIMQGNAYPTMIIRYGDDEKIYVNYDIAYNRFMVSGGDTFIGFRAIYDYLNKLTIGSL